jgi:hypothetical protein
MTIVVLKGQIVAHSDEHLIKVRVQAGFSGRLRRCSRGTRLDACQLGAGVGYPDKHHQLMGVRIGLLVLGSSAQCPAAALEV